MNSKNAFILMGVLLVLIPSVVYLLFRDQMHSEGGDIPSAPNISAGMSVVSATVGKYQGTLEPEKPPFKTGKQTLKLTLLHQQTPVEKIPAVAVTMPMGTSTMTAPVELKPTSRLGTFDVHTDFSMPGPWEVHVKPDAKVDLALHFTVQ